MPHNDLSAKQLARATRALEAYDQHAFPSGDSPLSRDQLYAEALLSALIGDLERYALTRGLNFTDIVNSGRSLTAQEAAEHVAYTVGDEVRLTRQGNCCGTVVGWKNTTPDAEPTFLVEVPGIPYVISEPATHLAPAPPFPHTETILGTVKYADQAEHLYVSLATRLAAAKTPDRRVLKRDCDKLIEALSSWTGVPASRLLDELGPKPPGPKPPPGGSSNRPQETRAAADGFPYDITKGVPTTRGTSIDRPAKQPKPGRGPTQTA